MLAPSAMATLEVDKAKNNNQLNKSVKASPLAKPIQMKKESSIKPTDSDLGSVPEKRSATPDMFYKKDENF